MNIAYLISAHTDAPQLTRLINALHADAHFFIHIDLKSDITQFAGLQSRPNVHFLPNEKRINVRWGTILEVDYQMNLIKAALDYPVAFDRIFFLSGMDYPLWSNERITAYLESLGEKEVLQGICMSGSGIRNRQKRLYRTPRPFVNYSFLSNKTNERIGILLRKLGKLLGRRKHLRVDPFGLDLYKGSAWWCITQGLASYLYNKYTHVPELRRYFTDSFGPAETLIQTIAFNSRTYGGNCILSRGEYTTLAALTPLHFIDYDPVIKIMDETDYDRLYDSDKMFTRKVVSGRSDRLVEMIDAHRASEK